MFEKKMIAGWGDMDFNSHMRNTAFLDKSGDIRMMYFSENGFPMSEFLHRKLGPVIMKDDIEYFKEIQLLEEFRVTLSLAGLSDDGSRFTVRNEFFRADNKLAATVTSNGGWFDLSHRKLVSPPQALLTALRLLPKTKNFATLPASVK